MRDFIIFIGNNWLLWSIWIVLLALLVITELQKRFRGPVRISTSYMTTLINRQDAVVVDLRDVAAYDKGHILSAKSIPHQRLNEWVGQLESVRDKPIILVDELGHHVAAAGTTLRRLGFNQVYSLIGGVSAWQSANLPLTQK